MSSCLQSTRCVKHKLAYPFKKKKKKKHAQKECVLYRYSTNALVHISVPVEHFILALLPVATRWYCGSRFTQRMCFTLTDLKQKRTGTNSPCFKDVLRWVTLTMFGTLPAPFSSAANWGRLFERAVLFWSCWALTPVAPICCTPAWPYCWPNGAPDIPIYSEHTGQRVVRRTSGSQVSQRTNYVYFFQSEFTDVSEDNVYACVSASEGQRQKESVAGQWTSVE